MYLFSFQEYDLSYIEINRTSNQFILSTSLVTGELENKTSRSHPTRWQ